MHLVLQPKDHDLVTCNVCPASKLQTSSANHQTTRMENLFFHNRIQSLKEDRSNKPNFTENKQTGKSPINELNWGGNATLKEAIN